MFKTSGTEFQVRAVPFPDPQVKPPLVQTILFAVNCIVGQFWCLQKQVNKILQATGVEYLPIIVVRKVIGLDKRVRQYGLGNRSVTDRSPMAARLYIDRLTAKL